MEDRWIEFQGPVVLASWDLVFRNRPAGRLTINSVTPEKTARMFAEKHDDVTLKLFGLWPFGDKSASLLGAF